MRNEIENLLRLTSQATDAWSAAFAAVIAIRPSDSAAYPNLHGATLDELNKRVLASLALVSGLDESEEDAQLLMLHRTQSFTPVLDGIRTQSDGIHAALKDWGDGTVTDTNGQLSLQVVSSQLGTVAYDLGSSLGQISKHINSLIDQIGPLYLAKNARGADLFVESSKKVQITLAATTEISKQAEVELAKGKAALEDLRGMGSTSKELLNQIQELLQSSTLQKTSVDGHTAELEQKLARAREVSKDADTLQQRVTGFTAQFEAFDSQMKTRLEQFSQFEKDTQKAGEQNLAREKTVDEIIDKADTMIRGATTAGLSKSLEDAKDAYEKRLSTTGYWFLGSVVVLLVCSLPIAAQIVPGPWQVFFKPIEGVSTDPWLATLGKLILLIPATWATAFFARNYAELFHLSREYAHKAALAKAIDGFKREAPEYKGEIVTGVFMEIRDNPGSRKSPEMATPQNPVFQGILEKLLDAIKKRNIG